MKKLSLAIAILTVINVLTACQKTPETPFVVQKDMERLIEAAQSVQAQGEAAQPAPEAENASSIAGRLEIPSVYHVDETYNEGKLRLVGNVQVEVPDVQTVPVIRVTHDNFSQELVNTLYDKLCADTPMYQRMALPTKDNVEQQIVLIKRQAAENPKVADQIERQIKELEKLQKIAPADLVFERAGPEIKPQYVYDMHTGKKLGESIGVDIGEEPSNYVGYKGKYFSVSNNLDSDEVIISENEGGWAMFSPGSRGATFYYEDYSLPAGDRNMITIMDVTNKPLPETLPKHLTYSPYDAKHDAIACLNSLGIGDVSVESVQLVCEFDKNTCSEMLQQMTDSPGLSGNDIPEQNVHKATGIAYQLTLVPTVSGIPVSSEGATAARLEKNEFSRTWSYETLRMTLMPGRVVSINWVSPHKQLETVTEDAALLPFNEIDSIFRRMLGVVYAEERVLTPHSGEAAPEIRFDLQRVRLVLRRVMEKDQVDFGLLIPVWDFYGTKKAVYADGYEWHMNLHEPLLMTINAIDGSIIDVQKGY